MEDFKLSFGFVAMFHERYKIKTPYFHVFKEGEHNWAGMMKETLEKTVKSELHDLVRKENRTGNVETLIESGVITYELMVKGKFVSYDEKLACRPLAEHVQNFRENFSGEKEMFIRATLAVK